jgi:hypothetical protein
VSLQKILHRSRQMQNSARCAERISNGRVGSASVPCDITDVKSDVLNSLPISLPLDMSSLESEAECQIWLDQKAKIK